MRSIQASIEAEMRFRSTEDLLEIWTENNRADWSDTAFDVIRKILIERLGEAPRQNPKTYERVDLWEQDVKEYLFSTSFLTGGLWLVIPLFFIFASLWVSSLFRDDIAEVLANFLISFALIFPIVSGIVMVKR